LLKFFITDKLIYIKIWGISEVFAFLTRPVMAIPSWLGFSAALIIYALRQNKYRRGNLIIFATIPFVISFIFIPGIYP